MGRRPEGKGKSGVQSRRDLLVSKDQGAGKMMSRGYIRP